MISICMPVCFLMVLPDDQGDGSLTARELYATPIHSDLIVMSACYSGLADRSPLPGDDLSGLQRAMLQSGARTIVSGLWDVYDETGPLLMQGFFKQLTTGAAAPKALANSQRAFLKQHRADASDPWAHPYFWSVYVINGDERTSFSP